MNVDSIGFLAGAGGLALSAYLYAKLNQMSKALDTSVKNLDTLTELDIEKAVVERAVEKAVEREVEKTVRCVSQEVWIEMTSQVRSEVNKCYSDMSASVKDKIAEQVAEISMDELTLDVKEKAKENALKKFDGSLDELLEKFNGNLNNIHKIYGSIAESMSGKIEKETLFRY